MSAAVAGTCSAVRPTASYTNTRDATIDPATGAATAAAGQAQVSVETALAALDPCQWQPIVAEERSRPMAGTGVDAVIRARRRS